MTMLPQDPALFYQRYRIYLEDTDAGGIVYHANHLKLFERCRRDWLRSLGMQSYFYQLASAEGQHPSDDLPRSALQFVISQANVRYLKPILLDSLVVVTVSQATTKSASLVLEQRIYAEQDKRMDLLSQAELTLVCVTTHQKNGRTEVTPARLPAQFIAMIQKI